MNFVICFIISLLLTFIIMPKLIPFLHKLKFSQTEREEGLESHKVKTGTPTMGGMIFVLVPIIVSIVCNYKIIFDPKMQIIFLAFLGYGLIGFIDDFIIVVKKDNAGLKASHKFIMQSVLAVIFFVMYTNIGKTTLMLPILNTEINIGGILFFILIFIMFTAESNAVNLTDGLDGLCAGVSIIGLVPFFVFALMEKNNNIALFIIAVIASLLGYLYFNKYPAKIFMGDTGSLAIGGLFAAIALVMKKEIVLIIIGMIFILETLSVIIQVTYFRKTGKRIFEMAPIHHHFEKCGMKETRVCGMFYIAALIFAILGFIVGVM